MDYSKGWPPGLVLPGPLEHREALGALALCYNELEIALYVLLHAFHSKAVTDFLFATLHNSARVDLIKVLSAEELEPSLAAEIAYGVKCFDIICENRNLALHAFTWGAAKGPIMTLVKPRSRQRGLTAQYDIALTDLRAAAVEAANVGDYLFRLGEVIPLAQTAEAPLPALPIRPQVPNKLSSFARPATPEAERS